MSAIPPPSSPPDRSTRTEHQGSSMTRADLVEAWGERAAIYEFDGEMSREEAQRLADVWLVEYARRNGVDSAQLSREEGDGG